MFQTLQSWLSSAYVEIIILALLLAYFFHQRKDKRLIASGIRLVRTIIMILVFSYFMFIWASTVEPSLRHVSVFGMFLVNLYFFYNLVLAHFERPYRDALAGLGAEPRQPDILRTIWISGKRFYQLRYLFASVFSGINPLHFLGEISSDRVRDDIKDELHRLGVEKRLITLPVMVSFLQNQLACDDNLPADFKETMGQVIVNLTKHPWLEEQVNEFLRVVTESPEDMHFPQWMNQLNACVKPK